MVVTSKGLKEISAIKIGEYVKSLNQSTKEIEYKKIEKYRSSIIVVSGDYSMIRQVYNSDYIYRCFLKPFNFNEIEESIEKIICENNYEMETDVKSKINKELKKLKFNFTYKGTKYLSECIYQIYKSNESDVDN